MPACAWHRHGNQELLGTTETNPKKHRHGLRHGSGSDWSYLETSQQLPGSKFQARKNGDLSGSPCHGQLTWARAGESPVNPNTTSLAPTGSSPASCPKKGLRASLGQAEKQRKQQTKPCLSCSLCCTVTPRGMCLGPCGHHWPKEPAVPPGNLRASAAGQGLCQTQPLWLPKPPKTSLRVEGHTVSEWRSAMPVPIRVTGTGMAGEHCPDPARLMGKAVPGRN